MFLSAPRLIVGLMTGSLGILAGAAHQAGSDRGPGRLSRRAHRGPPPDERYRYGCARGENLSALIETLLLLATCVWIIDEAIQRLFIKPVEIEASLWALV